jgi:hypothetical protein
MRSRSETPADQHCNRPKYDCDHPYRDAAETQARFKQSHRPEGEDDYTREQAEGNSGSHAQYENPGTHVLVVLL